MENTMVEVVTVNGKVHFVNPKYATFAEPYFAKTEHRFDGKEGGLYCLWVVADAGYGTKSIIVDASEVRKFTKTS